MDMEAKGMDSRPLCEGFFQAVSGEGKHFNGHLMATTVCCGTMFYTGLRLGRYFLSPVLTAIPAADYGNLRADAQLSVLIMSPS